MRMIFHAPFALHTGSAVGSDIRPVKMLEAFRSLGYEVDVVAGQARERRAGMASVRGAISKGAHYEFLYSESSPLPTAFTHPSKFPLHPFLDHAFLWSCRKANISLGLFYRDIYWKFADTGQYRSALRRRALSFFYAYDLLAYNFYLKRMYLPSLPMREHIPLSRRFEVEALPPGHDASFTDLARNESVQAGEPLHFLYVGGLGSLYDLRAFIRVIGSMPDVRFTLCTRAADWEREHLVYEALLTPNVRIVHKQGDDLRELYSVADVGVFFVKPTVYSQFAVSIKAYEYIGNEIPVLAVAGTHIGNTVAAEGLGWAIPFQDDKLRQLIQQLVDDPDAVGAHAASLLAAKRRSTWVERARQVASDLSASSEPSRPLRWR